MTRLTLLISLAGVTLLPTTALTAQEAQPDSDRVRAAWAILRSDLRNFVTAQEIYFADHRTYAPSLREMGEIYLPSPGVTVVVLTSSDSGHSEIAIFFQIVQSGVERAREAITSVLEWLREDERVPGLVCAMYIGNAPPPLGSGLEGEPVCRGP